MYCDADVGEGAWSHCERRTERIFHGLHSSRCKEVRSANPHMQPEVRSVVAPCHTYEQKNHRVIMTQG